MSVESKMIFNPKTLTLKWLLYWFLVMGFLVFIIKPLGYNYNNSFVFYTLFFVSSGFFGLKIFNSYHLIKGKFSGSNHLYCLIVPSFMFFIASFLTEYYIPISEVQMTKIEKIGFMFPLFNLPTLIAKLGDIIFQQLMIFTLILTFKSYGIKEKQIIVYFTLIFLFLHIPLIYIFEDYGLFFVIPSILAGSVFSFLILKFKNGHLYSILVHQAFYLILGIVLRLYL